jgi:peptidoglycan hydrolase-like protein with peptidoglycan-binding domain
MKTLQKNLEKNFKKGLKICLKISPLKAAALIIGIVFTANLVTIPVGTQTANAMVYDVTYPTGFGTGYSATGGTVSTAGSDSVAAVTEAQYTYPYGSSASGYNYSTGYTGSNYYGTGYGTGSGTGYTGACVNLSRTLSYGVTGTDVSALQQFLINQGLLATGLITGYFGGATMKAVETFQYDHDIPATGAVGTETIQAIQAVSCGGTSGGAYTGYTGTYTGYNGYTGNNYNNSGYYYGGAPVITSLSVPSGYPGEQVTIYGSGFDPYNNTVNFSGATEAGISSINGTQLTFTVPYLNSGCSYSNVYNAYPYTNSYPYTNTYPYSNCAQYQTYPYQTNSYQTNQTYQITVIDSRGTSNAMQFTLVNNGNNGCTYYGCQNYYGNNLTPSITYITPTIGDIGTLLTIYGSGFSYSGNIVHIGAGEILNVGSSNTSVISFTLPEYLNAFCQTGVYCAQYSQTLTPGNYGIYITNQNGYNSNTEQFTVTNGGNGYGGGSLSISNLNGPTSLSIDQSGTWTLNVYDQSSGYLNTSVNWGDGQYNNGNQGSQYYSGNQSQTLSFSHTYVNAGTYTITFTVSDSYGNQATANQTVYIP